MPAYKSNLEVQIKQDQKQGMGLIDHEQTDTFPVWKFKGGSTTIYEENQVYTESAEMLPNKNQLLKVSKSKNHYEILLSVMQPPFMVVKDIKSSNGSEYPLVVNSVIRLGRVEYKVIEERNKHMQTFQAPCSLKYSFLSDSNVTYQCKFCFMEGRQSKDQLFLTNICRCAGNGQAVHLDCLRYWVDSNITKEETQFGLTLKWNKQHEFSQFEFSMKMNTSISLHSTDLIYSTSQQKTSIKRRTQCNEIYLIHSLLSDNIKIGRGFQCDIKAQDITVSRHHATIKLTDGNFMIQDNKSKFGTLVSIDKKVSIDCAACSLQIGKLLINFIQSDYIQKGAPSTQHKLTQLPQINKQLDEDEPQMDDDSFQLENK
ncbi:unnamed protein product (macronuclear) [Paramecium tetraurelia]|uniref:FHA domain-containing protein n=1 Tax=Paramecium tetraurelia TaxID=5888 RepID=A0C8X2_PARTE|nr:uncharacterized protein GSPATT00036374001 [Paramecium tetraurelia]CAK67239.1 unnamed protein product [Paramecium tetraurelia]|eukprot:XP_001434636.1 hypothetical protein (macronuclear) [Paramecium tetraurelia strain d4-2]